MTSAVSQSSIRSCNSPTGVCGQIADSGLDPDRTKVRQQPLRVRRRFVVKRNPIATRRSKIVNVALRFLDHEMGVERQGREFTQIADDLRSPRHVRHEMPVHHVEMKKIGTGTFHTRYLVRYA